MGQALYRKYRSKNLEEIVGQEHITRTLTTALSRGAISHAYLLTGPRGVGKTSIARILAYQINDLPYESERVHLDIIEIDAASNRRIDEIRDLRDKVHNAPTSAKYRVYIIDEVHMLTREAFNALLKTLEEPPKHAIFILATTDVHKLPDTIVSRTQHFTFKPISEMQVAEHLKEIAKLENISVDDEALKMIARHGGGSFRDSIGLLEQAAAVSDQVTSKDIQLLLGIPPRERTEQLKQGFLEGDTRAVISALQDLSLQGFLAEQIAAELARLLRQGLIDNSLSDPSHGALVIKELLEVPVSRDPTSLLEVILLSNMRIKTPANHKPHTVSPAPEKHIIAVDNLPSEPSQIKAAETSSNKVTPPTKKAEENTEPKKTTKTAATRPTSSKDLEIWEETLHRLKKSHSTLYSIARMADFSIDKNEITLGFQFAFHQKRIESSKNKEVIVKLLEDIGGRNIQITCIVNKETRALPPKKQSKSPTEKEDPTLEAISNIFGGGEMLES